MPMVPPRIRRLYIIAASLASFLVFWALYAVDLFAISAYADAGLYVLDFCNRALLFFVPIIGASFLLGKKLSGGRRFLTALLLLVPRAFGKLPDYYLYFFDSLYDTTASLLLALGQAVLESFLLGVALFFWCGITEKIAVRATKKNDFSPQANPYDTKSPLPLALFLLAGAPALYDAVSLIVDMIATYVENGFWLSDILYGTISLLFTLLFWVLTPSFAVAAAKKMQKYPSKG